MIAGMYRIGAPSVKTEPGPPASCPAASVETVGPNDAQARFTYFTYRRISLY